VARKYLGAYATQEDLLTRRLGLDRPVIVRYVTSLYLAPGTLALFAGRYSIHRVSPIAGSEPRLIALFGYDTRPGHRPWPIHVTPRCRSRGRICSRSDACGSP
jgi:hypothetical protein